MKEIQKMYLNTFQIFFFNNDLIKVANVLLREFVGIAHTARRKHKIQLNELCSGNLREANRHFIVMIKRQ